MVRRGDELNSLRPGNGWRPSRITPAKATLVVGIVLALAAVASVSWPLATIVVLITAAVRLSPIPGRAGWTTDSPEYLGVVRELAWAAWLAPALVFDGLTVLTGSEGVSSIAFWATLLGVLAAVVALALTAMRHKRGATRAALLLAGLAVIALIAIAEFRIWHAAARHACDGRYECPL